MKVVILCGGQGTRLREMTEDIPKPMVPVGGRPIIEHIIEHFMSYDNTFEFLLATGYKGEHFLPVERKYPQVKCMYTGQTTMTGGRLKRLEPLLTERFIVAYGDGLANVDIERLLHGHYARQIATITVTNPTSRFGLVKMDGQFVTEFIEKPVMADEWVNIGFMVFEPDIFNYLTGDGCVLEGIALRTLAKAGKLLAYKHRGFFKCMDTYRDWQELNELAKETPPPWRRL